MISSRYTSFYSILNPIPSSLLRENIEKLSQKLHFKAQMLINQNISNLGDDYICIYLKWGIHVILNAHFCVYACAWVLI